MRTDVVVGLIGTNGSATLRRDLEARGRGVLEMSAPSELVIEFAAADASAVVVGGFLSSGGLAAVADAIARRPDLGVVVVGPIEPSLEVLVALSSGVRGYVPSSSESWVAAEAVDTVLAGELVVPREVSNPLVQQVASGARSLRVSGWEGCQVELSGREWQVLVLLRQGRRTADIAERLVISRATVRTYVAALMHLFGVSSRDELSTARTAQRNIEVLC